MQGLSIKLLKDTLDSQRDIVYIPLAIILSVFFAKILGKVIKHFNNLRNKLAGIQGDF